jgi:hypothetical protein
MTDTGRFVLARPKSSFPADLPVAGQHTHSQDCERVVAWLPVKPFEEPAGGISQFRTQKPWIKKIPGDLPINSPKKRRMDVGQIPDCQIRDLKGGKRRTTHPPYEYLFWPLKFAY